MRRYDMCNRKIRINTLGYDECYPKLNQRSGICDLIIFFFIYNFIKNNSSLSLIFYYVSKAIDASTIGTLLEITEKTRDFWDTLRIRPPLFVDVHAYAWACMCVCVYV